VTAMEEHVSRGIRRCVLTAPTPYASLRMRVASRVNGCNWPVARGHERLRSGPTRNPRGERRARRAAQGPISALDVSASGRSLPVTAAGLPGRVVAASGCVLDSISSARTVRSAAASTMLGCLARGTSSETLLARVVPFQSMTPFEQPFVRGQQRGTMRQRSSDDEAICGLVMQAC
jgi:hypothetical protein